MKTRRPKTAFTPILTHIHFHPMLTIFSLNYIINIPASLFQVYLCQEVSHKKIVFIPCFTHSNHMNSPLQDSWDHCSEQ